MSSEGSRTFAYVANDTGVSVIDTAINEVVAKIPLPSARALAVAPNGRRLYVGAGSNLSVIGTTTNTVVSSVSLGTNPVERAVVAPDGNHAYLATSFPPPSGPLHDDTLRVLVFETATDTVVATIDVAQVGQAAGIAVSANGGLVYIACSDAVMVLDTAQNKIVAKITPPGPGAVELRGLAITPDNKRAYVTDGGNNRLFVLDLANNSVSATVKLSIADVGGVSMAPNGGLAYIIGVDGAHGQIAVIETTNNTVTGSITLPGYNMLRLAITPDGKNIYAGGDTSTGAHTANIYEADLATNTVVATLTLDSTDIAICTIPA